MSCPILLQRVDVYTQVNDICMQNTIKGEDGADKKIKKMDLGGKDKRGNCIKKDDLKMHEL